MISSRKVHPHDVGLPEGAVRKRRSRRLAAIMLGIAMITAAAGWFLLGTSIFNAIHIKDQPASLALVAYVLLIISSVTLVLGFWYMLLAQVERVARMVDAAELDQPGEGPGVGGVVGGGGGEAICPQCQRAGEVGDRFCRHCGAGMQGKSNGANAP